MSFHVAYQMKACDIKSVYFLLYIDLMLLETKYRQIKPQNTRNWEFLEKNHLLAKTPHVAYQIKACVLKSMNLSCIVK